MEAEKLSEGQGSVSGENVIKNNIASWLRIIVPPSSLCASMGAPGLLFYNAVDSGKLFYCFCDVKEKIEPAKILRRGF